MVTNDFVALTHIENIDIMFSDGERKEDNYLKSYSQKLVELREQKGLSQIKVAEELEISRSLLSMYENGERNPSDLNKKKLADYYGQTVGFIFFNEK